MHNIGFEPKTLIKLEDIHVILSKRF